MNARLEEAVAAARAGARRGRRAVRDGLSAHAAARVGAVLAVVVAGLLVFQYGALGLARHLGLVARREPFTALSFVRPNALPGRLAPGSVAHLGVRIENHEGARRVYRWRLVETSGPGGGREVAAGTETLPEGATRTFTVDARLPAAKGTIRLALRLAAPAEAISLRVTVG